MNKRRPQKITTFPWFDDQAEAAAKFYVSVFKNSRATGVARYSPSAAAASGKRAGQSFTALNGGPRFNFSPAVSLVVSCSTQKKLDGAAIRRAYLGRK